MTRQIARGFTLIELLIVVVIIGVLAAIALPKFANTRQQATRTDGIADMRNLATAQEAFFSDSSRYATLADTGTGAGKLNFAGSSLNHGLTLVATSAGWSGTIMVPGNQTCGIYSGTASKPAGMPASAQAGVAVCW